MDKNNALTQSSVERGHADRAPVTLVIEYDAAEDLIADYTESFASGEVFLETERPFATGTRVRLLLSFPGLLETIVIPGTVQSSGTVQGAMTSSQEKSRRRSWEGNRKLDERGEGGEHGGAGTGSGVTIALSNGLEREALADTVERVRRRDPRVVSRLVRVLVVEDNPHVAQLIRNGLRGSGRRDFGDELAFNFRTAANGREALELLRSETFDALIVDVYLPVMDGGNLINEIRTDDHLCQLPIIAVSAGGPAARHTALAAGADAFLDKPMRLREVVEAMRKLVDLGQTQSQAQAQTEGRGQDPGQVGTRTTTRG